MSAGDLHLEVAPSFGGSITSFRHGAFDLFRAWDGTPDPRRVAAFPLIPFSGRIDQGRFTFEGRDYALPLNRAGEPHAIHGDGWQHPWTVAAATDDHLSLSLTVDGPVFAYEAEQRFTLLPDRLHLDLAVANRAETALPYGLGIHPYLNRAGALLTARVGGIWLPDATNIPRRRDLVPVEWGFRLRRPVEELNLDHNFTGWSGEARIDWPDAGESLLVEADEAFRTLVVYVPPGQDFFCLEPVSHAADAVNRTPLEMTVLAPGQRLAGRITFRLPA